MKLADITKREAAISTYLVDAQHASCVKGELVAHQKALIDLLDMAAKVSIELAALTPLYTPLRKNYESLIQKMRTKNAAGATLSASTSSSFDVDCSNTHTLSWDQAFTNVQELSDTGQYNAKLKGPLDAPTLLAAMALIREASPVSLQYVCNELSLSPRECVVASEQLSLVAPIIRMMKGTRILLVDICNFFDQPEIFNTFMAIDLEGPFIGPPLPDHGLVDKTLYDATGRMLGRGGEP